MEEDRERWDDNRKRILPSHNDREAVERERERRSLWLANILFDYRPIVSGPPPLYFTTSTKGVERCMVYPIDDCHDHNNNNSKYHCMDRRRVECPSSFLSSELYPSWRATHPSARCFRCCAQQVRLRDLHALAKRRDHHHSTILVCCAERPDRTNRT